MLASQIDFCPAQAALEAVVVHVEFEDMPWVSHPMSTTALSRSTRLGSSSQHLRLIVLLANLARAASTGIRVCP
ncbi:hypothetical protein ACFLX9_03940 [Chloroflexota bacterium]